jgi:4-hydroxy-tetrahydrodipicolinate synthase
MNIDNNETTTDMYSGNFAALLMPMRPDYGIDIDTLVAHINDLMANGCQGVAIFGTTGEAPHIPVEEKKRVLRAVIEKGISPKRLIVGVGHW